jgi:uncharacterized protein (TIGR00299 family) protein
MRIAYLDCSTGISGDMMLGALLDVGVPVEEVRAAIDALHLPGVRLDVREVLKGGFRATKVDVQHPEQHAHRHLTDIRRILEGAGPALTPPQRELALEIFEAVAEAEARVHGTTVDEVHFHEVGAIDSIVDIVGTAVGFDLLQADLVTCSRIPTGRGQVRIAHGVCPLPAPGTAELLQGIPLVDVPIEAELTTPTGAAIVRVLVDAFGALPEMTIEAVGYGAGTRDFPERANVLRLFVGESAESPYRDVVCLLETNLDDVTGEVIGHARHRLLEAGALDVYTTPIQMKKDRPGVLLSVLCRPHEAEGIESLLFTETGTLGIRRATLERSKQARAQCTVHTPWGPVQGKIAWRPGHPLQFTPEYSDCARLAEEAGIPLRDALRAAAAAFDADEIKLPPDAAQALAATHSHHHAHSLQQVHDHDHDHDHRHDHDHDHDHHH